MKRSETIRKLSSRTERRIFIHRGQNEIIADILKAARDGQCKTHLMYESDLDSRGLKKYLEFLISRKLIESDNTGIMEYKTTPRGFHYLEELKKLELLRNT